MAEPGPEPAARGGYFEELHVVLVVALVVICVTLGIVGWKLHPDSNGFQPVPQGIRILIAGSGFAATQTLTQAGNEGATLKVTAMYTEGVVPLVDSAAYTLLSGPQAAGAASTERSGGHVRRQAAAQHPLGVHRLEPGFGAAVCGAFEVPTRHGRLSNAVAHTRHRRAPLPTETSVGDTVPPPGLCLHWDTGAPVSLSGPYLSVRFPPLRGIDRDPFTEIPQDGDLGVATVTRTLSLEEGNNTANFAIQTDPHPTIAAPTSWTWVVKDTPQVIQVAATNSSAAQHENNDAFYSGVLFGVVGGALISLITELVVPLRHRRLLGHGPP